MADIVFIYNKNGYAGVSTTLEIGGALMLGKPIYALSMTKNYAEKLYLEALFLLLPN